ncbi:MAG: late competence development ComFB family protein [Peptococcaceae bacterium]|nr:late competence development ComFB family protein [Peptococcaceae bacterium]MDH7525363.1 late competence development ComFB family protein [Peptococcaceae bacterium]
MNYTLIWVWDVLDEMLAQRPEICRCEKCRYDMACLALNRLKPHYAVSKHGSVYTRTKMLSQQHQATVLTEVIRAIEQVSKNPHHLE